MSSRRRLAWPVAAGSLLLAAAAVLADAERPAVPALPFAVASAGCTQEDIPALEIVLTARSWNGEGSPPRPYVRIEVAGFPAGAEATIALSPLRRDPALRILARAELHGDDAPPIWLAGNLRIEAAGPGKPVKGRLSMCFSDASCATADFDTLWRPGPARCG